MTSPAAETPETAQTPGKPEKAERIIFFSDAVVAIAITLLALDLPVPDTTDSTTNGQLLHALGAQWPSFLAFGISFFVIGSHWSDHRRIFRFAERSTARISSLNMLWLLMMVLTPFAARLLASNGAFGVRFTIYAVVQIIAVSCQVAMERELSRAGLPHRDAAASGLRGDAARNATFITAFAVSIPVSFATRWAFAVWAAVPLGIRVWRALRPAAGISEPG